MDDLIQVLFFLFIVIFGLLGSSRKKKTEASGPRARPRAPDRATALGRRPRETPAPPPRAVEARRPLQTREQLEASLYDLLRGADLERGAPESEIRAVEETLPDEARSLETLTEAGGESHRRFHERFGAPTAALPGVRRSPPIPVRLDRRTVREAVVWKEILGGPKGLD